MTDTHRYCIICNIDISDKRSGAKTCSPKCRNLASRNNVTLNAPVTLNDTLRKDDIYFEFTIKVGNTNPNKPPFNDPEVVKDKQQVRKAKYWYDVPLAAVPVLRKGFPKMPDYMNGRQYFLWWKNEFKVGTGESPFDGPVLHNPFPVRDNIAYQKAGEGSRRWGA